MPLRRSQRRPASPSVPRPRKAPSQISSTWASGAPERRPPGAGTAAAWAGRLAGGFVAGLLVAGACATSDQVLEKKRREEMLRDGNVRCNKGAVEDCYEGPDGTAGRGACRLGRRTCVGEQWGACEGMVAPKAELCNGLDDNCDGVIDNGFERDGALCFYAGAKGACRSKGVWHCSEDGTQSQCDATLVKPQAETCDGIDNDCDGETDEDSIPAAQQECTTGRAGVCAAGTNNCIHGKVECVGNVRPGPEICNKKDDNCNGDIDEDCVTEAEAAKIREQSK